MGSRDTLDSTFFPRILIDENGQPYIPLDDDIEGYFSRGYVPEGIDPYQSSTPYFVDSLCQSPTLETCFKNLHLFQQVDHPSVSNLPAPVSPDIMHGLPASVPPSALLKDLPGHRGDHISLSDIPASVVHSPASTSPLPPLWEAGTSFSPRTTEERFSQGEQQDPSASLVDLQPPQHVDHTSLSDMPWHVVSSPASIPTLPPAQGAGPSIFPVSIEELLGWLEPQKPDPPYPRVPHQCTRLINKERQSAKALVQSLYRKQFRVPSGTWLHTETFT
ncbi:hypothetical protein HYDPIDRAFT_34353 [Hydnomerulius pinastri MD-312]|uniref:Uncharacterized protein n=1 Tax=Hydnomerulius pinastri MD-312 TaxID=994086 RepID=A0A0C9W7A6_9AGAM|nr:hypothetical protein HYDPIDRAFT_34353 [Hydnomerulius pinastri MD-312]